MGVKLKGLPAHRQTNLSIAVEATAIPLLPLPRSHTFKCISSQIVEKWFKAFSRFPRWIGCLWAAVEAATLLSALKSYRVAALKHVKVLLILL